MSATPRLHSDGDTIGDRYVVREFVGEGGMQQVYRAYDQTLEREVALKVPKNASAERRFKRSAELSARINHPNAAKTLDYLDHTNRPCLIEEFIAGQTLREVREVLPVMDPYLVAHVIHHLARGIAASHHVGVVHRDLKPGNIMVSSNLTFATVKVTDFGIAKMAEEELKAAAEGGDESITASATMLGAIAYMAPEMINEPHKTGKAADVWSIGAMCFELLSNVKPFGKGLKVVREIFSGKKAEFPAQFRNPQFDGLLDELLALVDRCLVIDVDKRITIDELVKECDRLCYPPTVRRTGIIDGMPGGSFGYIRPDGPGSNIFFHTESLYGERVGTGDRVCFVAFDGEPKPRAHPIVKLA